MWLGTGTPSTPSGQSGHVDGVAQYVAPGGGGLPSSPASPDFAQPANLEVLESALNARGRQLDVTILDPRAARVSCANHYIANGRVVVPLCNRGERPRSVPSLISGYDVVSMPGEVLAYGGGEQH